MTNRTLQPGDRFGQYKILRLLGRGGMGEVYAVEHAVLGKSYALKLLNPDLMDSLEARRRLETEARVMADLEHPSIVAVDEYGETDGRHWLRMELVLYHGDHGDTEGGSVGPSLVGGPGGAASLADYLEACGGRLSEAEVRELLRQILEGLAYAHGKGVVHRDLKPANILLDFNHGGHGDTEEKGHGAKIADFGLVRLVGEEWLRSQVERSVARSMSLGAEKTVAADSSDGTATRALLGTYAYMSPEQKRGEEADERSDLYAVGLMAYQMLTGRETLGMDRPTDVVPGINPAWDDWVRQATRDERAERPASAAEMLASLPEGGNGFTTEDTESTERERRSSAAEAGSGKGRRAKTPRKRKSGLGMAVLLLLLLAGLGYAGWHWGLPQWEAYQERQAEAARQEQALAEASAEQERLRSEVEAALSTGDLAVAGRGIAALEEAGAPVGDLKVRYEALGDAREARSRAGEAEVLRERVLALSRSDGEGLSDNVDGMESSWRAAERAFEDEVWGESLSGYDRVLREGEAVLEAAQEREKARRARSSAENLAGEVAALREQQGSEVESGFADLQKQAVSLGAEAERLYEQSAFAEAAAKWTEELGVLRQAQARGEGVLAYRAKRSEWEEALGEADRKLLDEFGGEKWEEARRLAATADRSEEDPVAGQRAYAGAMTALAAAISSAQEKSEPILEIEVLVDEKAVQGVPVRIGKKTLESPARLALGESEGETVEVAAGPWKTGGKLYGAETTEVTVDWRGKREPLRLALEESRGPQAGSDWEVELPGGESMELVWIKDGRFTMGSPSGEDGRDSDEGPRTEVVLTDGFWLGKYEVTLGDYREYLRAKGDGDGLDWDDEDCPLDRSDYGLSGNQFGTGWDQPVVEVSWEAAMRFCRWLTERERREDRLPAGYEYTLPSEAQWEYACRAGTTTRFSFGDSADALALHGNFADRNTNFDWSDKSANDGYEYTAPVGNFEQNGQGLYDMHGNVWEWTRSWYGDYPGGTERDYEGPSSGSNRVARGGGWYNHARNCRSANRGRSTPGNANNLLGFRVALAPSSASR